MGTTGMVEQYPFSLDLGWWQGDPISLQVLARVVNWDGAYQLQVRRAQDRTSGLLATLDCHGDYNAAHVFGTYSGPGTLFTILGDVADSAGVPAGEWYYDAQQVGGITRFAGRVRVRAQVTG